jgi:phage gp16-like protein
MKLSLKMILTALVIGVFSVCGVVLSVAAESVSFINTVTLGKEIRNDYGGFVGMKIKVSSKDIQVKELGRYYEKGNEQTHELQIVDHQTKKILGTVSVDMSKGKADKIGFKYASLKSPVTLKANMEYEIMSKENMNGDKWYGRTSKNMPKVTVTNAAQIITQIYGPKPPFTEAGQVPNQTYGPVNLKY